MKPQVLAILLGAVLTATALETDISGSYSGTVTVQTPNGERQRQTLIVIKQTPEKLAVSIGSNPDEQHPVSNTKLAGNKLTFDVVPPGEDRPAMRFDLRIEEDKLTGTLVAMPPGVPRTGTVDLKKQ